VVKKVNVFFLFRLLLGGLFILSGAEKLLNHYQNFLYVVQSYSFLPPALEKLIAFIVPWVELILGLFLVLGLWLRYSLSALLLLILGFIVVVAQAILRGLPLDECGCFGSLITFRPEQVILLDSVLLFLTVILLLLLKKTRSLSLDEYFS
jgi:uncharacterized membrane protein YphA (DoxX/SURF4 family)